MSSGALSLSLSASRYLSAVHSKKIDLRISALSRKKSLPTWRIFKKNLLLFPFWRCHTLESFSCWTQTHAMYRAALHYCKTCPTQRNDQLATGGTQYQNWNKLTIHSARLLSYHLVYTFPTSVPPSYSVHHSNRPQFELMDFELSSCDLKTRTVATLSIWIWLRCCASRWCQALDIRHPSRLPTEFTYNLPLKDELPVLVIVRGENIDDTTTTIIALKAHESTPAQSVTNSDVKDARPPASVKLITAQSADEFLHDTTRQFCHAGKEITFNKDGVPVRCVPIVGALQKPVPQSLWPCILYLSHHPPLSGPPG